MMESPLDDDRDGPNPTGIDRFGRIRWISRYLKIVALIGAVGIGGLSPYFAAVPSMFDAQILRDYDHLLIGSSFTPVKRVGLILLLAGPVSLLVYAMWRISRLFACYERGRIFAPAAARHIRAAGAALAANGALSIPINTLAVLLMTYDNAPGKRMLAVEVSSTNYATLLFRGLLIVIGWVMHEAARVADENRRFI